MIHAAAPASRGTGRVPARGGACRAIDHRLPIDRRRPPSGGFRLDDRRGSHHRRRLNRTLRLTRATYFVANCLSAEVVVLECSSWSSNSSEPGIRGKSARGSRPAGGLCRMDRPLRMLQAGCLSMGRCAISSWNHPRVKISTRGFISGRILLRLRSTLCRSRPSSGRSTDRSTTVV